MMVENIKTIGIITYHHPYLKTEQVLHMILHKNYTLKIYALPFKPRPLRKVLFHHMPNQMIAIEPQVIAEKHNIPYKICQDDKEIDNSCDIYLLLGAGILSAECVANKKIINCHPGIIPACRGLDPFKWSILEMKPLGVTLHFINEEIDAGEIIAVVPTPVYRTDSLETLARRHYENMINCLARFDEFLKNPQNPFKDIEPDEPKKRMPLEKEEEMLRMFDKYLEKYGS